jgi:hypothetical protein
MPKWFGGKVDDGVPRVWRAALETILRRLDMSSHGWAAQARDVVLTVFPEVGAVADPAAAMLQSHYLGLQVAHLLA